MSLKSVIIRDKISSKMQDQNQVYIPGHACYIVSETVAKAIECYSDRREESVQLRVLILRSPIKRGNLLGRCILQTSFLFPNLLLFQNGGSQLSQAKGIVKANWFLSNS